MGKLEKKNYGHRFRTAIILVIVFIILLLLGGLFYLLQNKNSENLDEEFLQPTQNGIFQTSDFPRVSGLRVVSIQNDSPLKHIKLVTLKNYEEYGESSFEVGDVITGVSTNYDKTNYFDIIRGERNSKYFLKVSSEDELYSIINKNNSDEIILGIVRREPAGTGLVDMPDLAVFSVNKTQDKYLKINLTINK